MVDGIYMEFLGGSFTGYAYHMTAVHPDSIYFNHHSLSVQDGQELLLTQSGVSREDVNYINAYATSTPTGDLKDYRALIRCLGKNPELRVNPTKSMIDHLLGASGAVEAGLEEVNVGYADGMYPSEHQSRKSKRKRAIHECVCWTKQGEAGHESCISNSFSQNIHHPI
ncbi:hypothetical protein ACFX11_024909 [Malus domestica]